MNFILYSCLLVSGVEASLIPSSSRSIISNSLVQPHDIHEIDIDGNSNKRTYSTITKWSSLGWNLDRIENIRGGDFDSEDEYSDDVEDSDEEESDEESESESELSDSEADTDDEDEDESDDEEDEASSPSSSLPVKLSISTNLQSSLLDQRLDFTASRKRTVLSLKQAVSKTMTGRPPLSSIILKFSGRLLEDDETVDDIAAEVEEDDDVDSDVEDDDDGMIKLKLTCDIVPPVDAKFGIEFREKAHQMSTKELMDAYCVNMAGMMYNSEMQGKESVAMESAFDEDGDDDVESQIEEQDIQNHALNIRKRAAAIQKQMEQSLSSNVLELMEQEHERVQAHIKASDGAIDSSDNSSSGQEVIYGLVPQGSGSSHRSGRKGKTLKGGATMNIKRSLQRNMNVNWADTTRNSLLFLFFGYFGGRNSFSRSFLLLSSPLCFLIQTRPMKVAMKQLFYTMGEPPGILLSLLPAPQQAIMSLNFGKAMRELYDEKVLKGEEWYEVEMKACEEDSDTDELDWDYDDDEDDYDDDYDEESDDEY